jgi:uncharacterized phage protein gp47/JayE
MATSLYDLAQKSVQDNLTIIKQMVQEFNPDISVERGPFHDLVLYYSALFATVNQQAVADALHSIKIGRLLTDTTDVPDEHVDRVLENWNVKRHHSTGSTGIVTVVLKDKTSFVIPAGTIFTANNHKFKTRALAQIRAQAVHTEPSDIVVTNKNGRWEFPLPVVSITKGTSSNLPKDTQLRCNTMQMTYVKSIYAQNDFTGGTDDETNKQMLDRAVSSLARTYKNK